MNKTKQKGPAGEDASEAKNQETRSEVNGTVPLEAGSVKEQVEANFNHISEIVKRILETEAFKNQEWEEAVQELMDGDTARRAALIQVQDAHRAAVLEEVHIRKLPNKIITLTGWRKLVDAARKQLPGQQGFEGVEALIGKQSFNEANAIDTVLAKFEWLEDQHGNLGMAYPDSRTVYRLTDTEKVSALLETAGNKITGNMVSDNFAKKAMRRLLAARLADRVTDIRENVVDWKKVSIGKRCYRATDDAVFIRADSDAVVCIGAGYVGEDIREESKWPWGHLLTLDKVARYWWHDESGEVNSLLPSPARRNELRRPLLDDLWRFVLCNEDDRDKFLATVVRVLLADETQPVVEFIGPAGSAKSTAMDILQDLCDPVCGSKSIFTGTGRKTVDSFKGDQDRYLFMQNRTVMCLDNVSMLSAAQQDFFCTVSTGIEKDTRPLYTNMTVKAYIKNCIIFSGIGDMVTRPDLKSRGCQINFEVGNAERFGLKEGEEDLRAEWLRARGSILAGLISLAGEVHTRLLSGGAWPSRRDAITLAVFQVIHGEEAGTGLFEEDKTHSAAGSIRNDNFCLVLGGWLQQQAADGRDEFMVTSGECLQELRGWLSEQPGGRFKVEPFGDVQAPYSSLPAKPRGLGSLLNKFNDGIRRTFGWRISRGEHTEKGNMKIFEYIQNEAGNEIKTLDSLL